jgi:hypothetical protein
MTLFGKKPPTSAEQCEARCRELQRTMQEIVIAHAAVCYKHLNTEQLEAVQREWAQLIKGRRWAEFFADTSAPLPAANLVSREPTE